MIRVPALARWRRQPGPPTPTSTRILDRLYLSSTRRRSLARRDRAVVVVVARACAVLGLELVLPAVLAAMVELRVFLQYRLEVRLRRRARAEEIVRTSARAAVSHGDGSGANARRLAGWAGAR